MVVQKAECFSPLRFPTRRRHSIRIGQVYLQKKVADQLQYHPADTHLFVFTECCIVDTLPMTKMVPAHVTKAINALFAFLVLVGSTPLPDTDDSKTGAAFPFKDDETDVFWDACENLTDGTEDDESFASPEWFIRRMNAEVIYNHEPSDDIFNTLAGEQTFKYAIRNRALFYTRGMSATARKIATDSCGYYITIWDLCEEIRNQDTLSRAGSDGACRGL